MKRLLPATLASVLSLSSPAASALAQHLLPGDERLAPAPHAARPPAAEHVTHPASRGDPRHFNLSYWRGGHWWHGDFRGRRGWWWIVGPVLYWYPAAVAPYPDPFTAPGLAQGWWYWCPDYQQFYPFVADCPSGWQAVPPQ
jgi:hypothetical protein